MSSHRSPSPPRRAARTRFAAAALAAVAAATVSLVAAAPASAAGCGLLGLFPCPTPSQDPGSRTPGTPVAQVPSFDQSYGGGTNPNVGGLPSTAKIGVPDPGVVPVLGKVTAKADDGAYVVYESTVTSRVVDLMVYSPAVGGNVPVRLQLPSTWKKSPGASFPTLYLLHGGNEKADYQSWSLYSTEYQQTKNKQALVAMPSTGSIAYATNWWNYGSYGQRQYRTFVGTELPQLLQRGYRANSRAAIGGISSGANSALSVAMQSGGQYGAAASYSGLDDTQLPLVAQTIEFGSIVEAKAPAQMWGDALVNLWIWDANNPAAHADRLRGTKVFVSAGTGSAGPLDKPGAGDPFEPIVRASTQSFLGKASAAGVSVTSDLYAAGTHSWPYWSREFGTSWPVLGSGLGIS